MRELRLFFPAIILALGSVLLTGVRRQDMVPLAGPLRAMPVALAGPDSTDCPPAPGRQLRGEWIDFPVAWRW